MKSLDFSINSPIFVYYGLCWHSFVLLYQMHCRIGVERGEIVFNLFAYSWQIIFEKSSQNSLEILGFPMFFGGFH